MNTDFVNESETYPLFLWFTSSHGACVIFFLKLLLNLSFKERKHSHLSSKTSCPHVTQYCIFLSNRIVKNGQKYTVGVGIWVWVLQTLHS